ncbi:MAG TPA: hypothetical protein DDW89_00395 [Gammaproteobacteria bacterium]|nr:hypothetical protein [Gammaproteobacteria bacterium]
MLSPPGPRPIRWVASLYEYQSHFSLRPPFSAVKHLIFKVIGISDADKLAGIQRVSWPCWAATPS